MSRAQRSKPFDKLRERRTRGIDAHRVVWQAASLALTYPDDERVGRATLLQQALAETTPDRGAGFAELLRRWQTTPLTELQIDYVEVFDLSRKRALHLSYWTDGDTRRRGEVLAGIKQRYRASGFLVRLNGELPDNLPLVCEYAAVADPVDGVALLQEYRASLELLRFALLDRSPAYAGVLTAICGTLPGASPRDRAAVRAIAGNGPPTESVGLAPYDARLLPVLTTAGASGPQGSSLLLAETRGG